MKILCCCAGGNCRSVGLAYLLKDFWHIDALALGLATVSGPETRTMLFEWADHIIPCTDEVNHGHVPEQYQPKTSLWDVGPDRWGNSLHPELLSLYIPTVLESFGPPVPEHRQTVERLRSIVHG